MCKKVVCALFLHGIVLLLLKTVGMSESSIKLCENQRLRVKGEK